MLLARHAESELSVRGIVNGEPQVRCGLTAAGEEQARELGRRLADEPLELAATSDFDRCRQTARIALGGREPRILELSELGDVRCGVFEGEPSDRYRDWAWNASASATPPGGGESRVAAARRFAAAARVLLQRPERVALVVAHQISVGYLLVAADGERPRPRVETVPYAAAVALTAVQLRRAAETLDAWAACPDW